MDIKLYDAAIAVMFASFLITIADTSAMGIAIKVLCMISLVFSGATLGARLQNYEG